MQKKRYTKWECPKCNDEFITDSQARWQMESCKDGCTSVDAEEHYVRFIGNNPTVVGESDNLESLK